MKHLKFPTMEQTVVILFSVLPIVDSLNGLFIQNGLPSVGSAYKLATLGLLCWFVLRSRCWNLPILVAVAVSLGYLAFSIGLNLLLGGRLHTPGHAVKLAFNILTFGALCCLWKGKRLSGDAIFRILRNAAWLMAGMLLIPWVLGLGNSFYAGGLGYKGFFYSGNELSVSLLILFFFCLFRVSRQGGNILQLILITGCLLLLSTKSAIAAALLGYGALGAEYILRKGKENRRLLIGAGAGLLLGGGLLIRPVAAFWRRQQYLFSLYGGNILATVLSGRNFLLEGAWGYFLERHTAVRFFFGNGFCSPHLVEMDFLDLFFYLGILGALAITGFFLWFFLGCLKHCRSDGTILRPLGFLTVLGFAFLAGHTLFMAMSGCYFVLFCCFLLMYDAHG